MSSSSLNPRPKPWESRSSTPRVQHLTTDNHNPGDETPPPLPTTTPPQMIQNQQPTFYNPDPYAQGFPTNSYMQPNPYMGSSYGMNSAYGLGVHSGYNMGFTNNSGMNGVNQLTESTRATFQLLENLIGTINGFANMLESSYFATYNSFFTLVSFAEEIGRLKEVIGGMFGIFNIFKFIKRLQRTKESSFVKDFKESYNNKDNDPVKKKRRRLAWKPLIFFFMAVFGFPYLLNKFVNHVNERNKRLASNNNNIQLDPTKLEFARAIYNFVPENPNIEVNLQKGDLMAILSKKDSFGNDSQWWKVRTKNGSVGFVPFNYIEVIIRKPNSNSDTNNDSKIERVEQSN
ncbi:hypothetical protein KAFR_0L01580 [Kazachstania africana CBS 2517]|uniref:Peroxisomal membrane protein PEX13 n=1 Tax=Kazachstania africana (strain ATCC 22294 / BCRC 22015 / CBS 2517 / CECT 1963 / NBRC 1671 / NRRL Y-8276) TaxID=1071382 RepID=H2B2B8_KAZAF|nr:hypothetical protein KAFR_0L01580 [Kazachstania africana CBS 2517]CCF60768.1 hypothetical protein KAFR_0L01580 [Kazachstania africana CBS 2517]